MNFVPSFTTCTMQALADGEDGRLLLDERSVSPIFTCQSTSAQSATSLDRRSWLARSPLPGRVLLISVVTSVRPDYMRRLTLGCSTGPAQRPCATACMPFASKGAARGTGSGRSKV
jgi:hypothetical protein